MKTSRLSFSQVAVALVLATLPAVIFLAGVAAEQGDWGGTPLAALMVLPGAASGWVLHRVAYGKTPARP